MSNCFLFICLDDHRVLIETTEEFGSANNKIPIYTAWYNALISSGLTGNLYWQAGSQLSGGPTHDDGYAVYPNTDVYNLVKDAAARLKARG